MAEKTTPSAAPVPRCYASPRHGSRNGAAPVYRAPPRLGGRPRLVRRGRGGDSSRRPGPDSRRPPTLSVAAPRPHSIHAARHPRFLPGTEVRGATVARGLLAAGCRAIERCGVGGERRRVPEGSGRATVDGARSWRRSPRARAERRRADLPARADPRGRSPRLSRGADGAGAAGARDLGIATRSRRAPAYRGSTRTRVVPASTKSSALAARRERSMIRPPTKGPRSFTLTTTLLRLPRFVTRTRVPSASVRLAAVSFWSS